MVNNLQAVSAVRVHHVKQLIAYLGDDTITLADALAEFEDRLTNPAKQDYQFACPKCKGKGEYLPSVDSIEIPDFTPIGTVQLNNTDLEGGAGNPAKVTCSICAGEGMTNVAVQAIPVSIDYSNAP